MLLKGTTERFVVDLFSTDRLWFEMETEGRLQKYVQHSLTVYYSIYSSLHVFMQPDKGRDVGKFLKQSMCVLQRKVLKEKNFQCQRD